LGASCGLCAIFAMVVVETTNSSDSGVNKVLIERDFTDASFIRFIEQCPIRIQDRVFPYIHPVSYNVD
jgi:hypothetical protein